MSSHEYEQVSATNYGGGAEDIMHRLAREYQERNPFFSVQTREDEFGGFAVFASTEQGIPPSQEDEDEEWF